MKGELWQRFLKLMGRVGKYIQRLHRLLPWKSYRLSLGDISRLVTTDDENVFFINEEGKLHGLPYNEQATHFLADRLQPGDYIVGPAVLMTEQEAGE